MRVIDFIADVVAFGSADGIIGQELDVIRCGADAAGYIERIAADPYFRQAIFLYFFDKTFTKTHILCPPFKSVINNNYLLR